MSTPEARPQLYLNHDPAHDFLLALEFGRIDEGQPEGSWEPHSEQLGFLHDGPGGRCLGFRLQEDISAYDPDDEDNEALWRDGPRFDVPLLGLRDVATNEVIVAALAHFGGRRSHNRDLFAAAIDEEDKEAALELWKRCLEAGDSMAHYALGYTLLELRRIPEAYRHLRHYTEIAPREAWAHAYYGRAAAAMGEEAEARAAFERAIVLEEERGEETDAAERLAALDGEPSFVTRMADVAGLTAWRWDGDADDPYVLIDVADGPVLAHAWIDEDGDAVTLLRAEVRLGDEASLPPQLQEETLTQLGRVWIGEVVVGEEPTTQALRAAARRVVERVQTPRAVAVECGFGRPRWSNDVQQEDA